MEKLSGEREFKVGEDGLIAVRNPTNKEWNEFEAARYPIRRNKLMNHAGAARAALFDKIVTRIENIEDDRGPITLANLDRIPERIKGKIVFRAFESDEEVEEKN